MGFIQLQDPAGLGEGISTIGTALGQVLQQAAQRRFQNQQLAKQQEFQRAQQEALFGQQSALASQQAESQTALQKLKGEQALATQAQKYGLEGQQEAGKRARAQQTGTILENLLSQYPQEPSIKDIQDFKAQAISEGVDPELVENFTKQYEPLTKEKIKERSEERFWKRISQLGSLEERGPEGTIYENYDNVPNNLNQSQIDLLVSSPDPALRDYGKTLTDRRKETRRNWENDRDFHAKGLEKTQERIDNLRETLPKRERVLALSRNSIESGETGRLSINQIANTIGGPIGDLLRTKSGAQFALAAKENLVTSLGEISARAANMFMEKRLLDAFANVGQSDVANLAVNDFLETENDLDKAYLKAYDRLAEQDTKRFGYERKDLAKRARKEAEGEQQKIFNRSSLRQRTYLEQEKGTQWMYKQANKKVDKGTPLTPKMYKIFVEKIGDPEKALIRAKQMGYSVFSPDEMAIGKI